MKNELALTQEIDMTKQILSTSASEPSARSQDSARIARDDGDLTYRVILVPIDFSEHSKRTVEYATRFAARYQATVRLLHVFQIPDYAVTQYEHRQQGCEELKSQVDLAEEVAQENLSAFEHELLNKGIPVNAYLRVGYPFEEIVLMANDPDVGLIIIGSHGRTGIKRLLLGSTAERVVEHAPCPVLVVKEMFLSA